MINDLCFVNSRDTNDKFPIAQRNIENYSKRLRLKYFKQYEPHITANIPTKVYIDKIFPIKSNDNFFLSYKQIGKKPGA